jgi:G:T-mismatch repair DNA endonuclease (very short patch repair protein)
LIDRKEILENQGYTVVVVWEREFKKKKKETISKLCNILKDKYGLENFWVNNYAN